MSASTGVAIPQTDDRQTANNGSIGRPPIIQLPNLVDMSRGDRVGFFAVAFLALVAIIAALVFLVSALEWRARPFIGAMFTYTQVIDGSRPILPGTWEGLDIGLVRGDRVLSINDQLVSDAIPNADPAGYALSRQRAETILRGLQSGDTVNIRIFRSTHITNPDATALTCEVIPEGEICSGALLLSAFPQNDFIALFLVPYLSGIVVLIAGMSIFILRHQGAAARIAALGLLTLSIFMTGLFDLSTTFALTPLWLLASGLCAGTLVAFGFIFPTRTTFALRYPNIRFIPPLAGFGIGFLLLLRYLDPPTAGMGSSVPLLATLILFSGTIFLVVTLVARRRYMPTLATRDQANTVLIGAGLSGIVGVIWLLNLVIATFFNLAPIPLNTSAAMPFMIIPSLSITYAVLQYRALNTDRVLNQLITYTVMLIGLIFGYFLLVFSASLIAREFIGANDPILIAIVIFIMAIVFIPVRTRLQTRIDQIYFRTRYDYQNRIERFASQFSSLANFDDVIRAYRDALDETLQPETITVFLPDVQTGDYAPYSLEGGEPTTDIRFAADSPLLGVLRSTTKTLDGLLHLEPGVGWDNDLVAERARLMILRALVIAPLRGASGDINGFVVIATPKSRQRRYTLEELRFISALTSQISVAVERAQVVNSLERRVRELDVLSQVSQAVNFTVDYDDLLELISAQADKLIDATHFYITLRDAGGELYHAFFLEAEERYPDRENRRWAASVDCFSEVIRGGQPIRVDNFAASMRERGATMTENPIDPNLKAWMGVPMFVGSRVLGALSAGTDRAGQTYSAEQAKIFGDIAALAATSIDKARLFAETNARARQLSVLNDISRQLVASELNLEELLKLITGKTAEILEAEAGSLLLTTDDDTGDLEFRVAVGGSGAALVGLRIPAGRGLVGEVAKTGKPVIVNDVATDKRWAGEFAKGAFQTTGVIAVPLITQNRVIGVLEVLNKRDNGTFSDEDTDLLTTFAGQAAVAIENARLFQMTDLQLSQRLSELETLGQIDVELNRSLDLIKVAKIAVNWALENSSASAAALGVVVGDTREGEPPMLEIVFQEGYSPEDMPEDAEGNRWRLDRGILARVLRTKQPDLINDVTIDPDYTRMLRGGKSMITLPMLSGGVVNALLILESNREPRLRLSDMPFLQRLAEHASIAIANAQLYAELTRANQSKSEFVSFVAHELKNPLTSIKGYSEFLLNGAMGALSDQQKNFVGTIRSNADRMNTLVSDLNDVTKLQTDNLRIDASPIAFADVVAETVRPLQKTIEDKGQTLHLEVPETLPRVNADHNRLIQVLTNLVSNAHKYSPPDGAIAVQASTDETLRDAKGRQLPPMLHVRVTDTGIGMSQEDQAKLFTPYFRSDNPLAQEQLGTGLGLTITRGIVERHGGTIWVESALNAGTTFHFTLPLAGEVEKV